MILAAVSSLYDIGGFLLGLAAVLTLATTVYRARSKIRHETSASSIQGFVSLVASYETRLQGVNRDLQACEDRDREKGIRLDTLERIVREHGLT